MGRPVRLLLSLLVHGLLAGCVLVPTSPDVPYTRVTVLVIDEGGSAVRGARVEAWGGLFRTDRRNVGFTSSDGEVLFFLPPARYDLFVHPPEGYTHVPPTTTTRGEVYADPAADPPSVTMVLAIAP